MLYQQTPHVQTTKYSCGASVFQSCAERFGHSVSHQEAIEITKCNPDGVEIPAVAKLLKQKYNLRYRTLRPSLKMIEQFLFAGFPIIASDNSTYVEPHMVLLISYDEANFYLLDSVKEHPVAMQKEQFLKNNDEFVAVYELNA